MIKSRTTSPKILSKGLSDFRKKIDMEKSLLTKQEIAGKGMTVENIYYSKVEFAQKHLEELNKELEKHQEQQVELGA